MIDYNSTRTITLDIDNILEFEIDFLGHSFTVNGLSLSGNWSSGRSLGNINKVLGCSAATTAVSSPQGKFYQLTHYRNGEVIHDYVPCVNPNGISGIFDVNNEVFIQNTNPIATEIAPGPAI